MISKKISRAVEGYTIISDRVITIRICGKPLNFTFVQVYAPMTDASEEEVERFYAEVEEALKQISKADIVYILGDFNTKVDYVEGADIVGRCGLGERNDADDQLVQFCQEHRFGIANT